MKILITGAAGFIGYHLARRLAAEDADIVCIDNINDYYDVDLKLGRLKALGFDCSRNTPPLNVIGSGINPKLRFMRLDITNGNDITALFEHGTFDLVVHLAAQAGVRYSLINPTAYIESNIQGFLNILEAVRRHPAAHLVYASSSSVYGADSARPFREDGVTDHPASLYAASKRANELMAHVYSGLYAIRATGLRFFTVYGPWGRPDMAPFIFAKSILEHKPITVFNNGQMERDFTYIDDIVEGIIRVIRHVPSAAASAHTVYNIGNGKPVALMDFIHALEAALGEKALIKYAPMQPGDVPATWADCSALARDTGYRPDTPLDSGIKQFAGWYVQFCKENKI